MKNLIKFGLHFPAVGKNKINDSIVIGGDKEEFSVSCAQGETKIVKIMANKKAVVKGKTSGIIYIHVTSGAKVDWVDKGNGQRYFLLEKDSFVDFSDLLTNGNNKNSGAHFVLIGKRSSVEIKNFSLLNSGKQERSEIVVTHLGQETKSSIVSRGIVGSGATRFTRVLTEIGEKAFGSEAHQKIENLLIDERGSVKGSPELKIKNNDVVCGHAVSTGHLDEENLFYLKSRGLDEKTAKNFLVRAFAEPFLKNIDLEAILIN